MESNSQEEIQPNKSSLTHTQPSSTSENQVANRLDRLERLFEEFLGQWRARGVPPSDSRGFSPSDSRGVLPEGIDESPISEIAPDTVDQGSKIRSDKEEVEESIEEVYEATVTPIRPIESRNGPKTVRNNLSPFQVLELPDTNVSQPLQTNRVQQISQQATSQINMVKHKHPKLPSNLPKFRGQGGIKDVDEFLNKFTRVCQANGVEHIHYTVMLLTCLEEIDAGWLERWLNEFQISKRRSASWNDVKVEFQHHFLNANVVAENLFKLHNLKMISDVQTYADEFLTLLNKVGWDSAS